MQMYIERVEDGAEVRVEAQPAGPPEGPTVGPMVGPTEVAMERHVERLTEGGMEGMEEAIREGYHGSPPAHGEEETVATVEFGTVEGALTARVISPGQRRRQEH